MKRMILVVLLGCALTLSTVQASDLNLTVREAGSDSSAIMVAPGAIVNYEIVAEFADANNGGLALLGFDLANSCGPLQQADAPTKGTTAYNFASETGPGGNKSGISNPAGFGGTFQASTGKLIQVGGGQNTIKNIPSNAEFPIGTVITNVAHPGSPVIYATGSFVAPMTAGTCDLIIENAFANQIMQGETGEVFFATEQAGIGMIVNLSVTVGDVIINPGNIVSSVPANNSIDARQPSNIDGSGAFGWDSIDITFESSTAGVEAAHFNVTINPADQAAPTITKATANGNTVSLQLDSRIPPGHWTNFTYTGPGDGTGDSVRLGFLPGDVSGDLTSGPLDILRLIDGLNGVPPAFLGVFQCDLDRSTQCGPADILREIDVLNGADGFDVWNGRTLPN